MDNSQIALARRYVEQTDVSLFLTGKAGTGKTTFLHDIDRYCPKRHVVVAPTGVAAVGAGGVTIHSFFQLPFDPYLPDVKEMVTEYQMPQSRRGFSKNKLVMMRSLELLIIDEVSMVRADLMDAIDMTLRRVRRSTRPFGGVQLLMVGDVHQLPPVVTDQERPYMDKVYPSPFFFHSKALQRLDYVTIELTTVYRQQEAAFVDLLNCVRDNRMDDETLRALNGRVGNPPEGAIVLTTHNYQAEAINRAHMAALPDPGQLMEASLEGNFPESMYPVEGKMELKVGERVMFCKNDSSGAHRYYNGKIGTLTAMVDGDGGTQVEVTDDEGVVVSVGRESWENHRYVMNEKTGAVEQVTEGRFVQYPLRPAWAVTIHKAQGLTFDRVSVNAADAFAYGQVYVALSRCRTLEGLTLTTPLTPAVTFADTSVQRFCEAQPSFEQTALAVDEAERQYYYRQLSELFGAEALLDDCDRVVEVYTKLQDIYPRNYEALLHVQRQVADLAAVGERFCAQLMRLPMEQHADRIAKGSEYYLKTLTALQLALRALLEVEVDNRETSRRLAESGAVLTERVGVKVACLEAVQKQGFSVSAVQQAKTEYLLHGHGTKEKSRRKERGVREDRPRRARKASPETLPEKSRSEVGLSAAQADELVSLLSAWRRRKAEEQKVSAFMVMHQKTLVTLANRMPATMQQLLSVPGIGRTKAEQYGEELLCLIAEFRNEVCAR